MKKWRSFFNLIPFLALSLFAQTSLAYLHGTIQYSCDMNVMPENKKIKTQLTIGLAQNVLVIPKTVIIKIQNDFIKRSNAMEVLSPGFVNGTSKEYANFVKGLCAATVLETSFPNTSAGETFLSVNEAFIRSRNVNNLNLNVPGCENKMGSNLLSLLRIEGKDPAKALTIRQIYVSEASHTTHQMTGTCTRIAGSL